MLCCALLSFGLAAWGQQPARPLPVRAPLVRSWTIREIGNYRKIPTAALRSKMAQRGVLFAVDEPYDQNKVDGTVLLLKQVYKEAGVAVTVAATKIQAGPNAVKVEYTVHRQP
jgi:outer membrane protein assembly factor BamA